MAAHYSDHFRAMDTDIDVELLSDAFPIALAQVRTLFAEHERIFSRFLPDSLTSRLNAGETVEHPLFVEACRLAIAAFEETGGLFNPMILPALESAGYDRTFSEVSATSPPASRIPEEGPGGEGIPSPVDALCFEGATVRLVTGRLDLGGIVKGWTVDHAIAILAPASVAALVNAGGDLRCSGDEAPGSHGWDVSIAGSGESILWSGTISGALATSTTRKRRWHTASGAQAHHLIDPRTGLPSTSPYAQVSVLAPETWRAEVWAKAILIGGPETVTACPFPSLALTAAGATERSGLWPS